MPAHLPTTVPLDFPLGGLDTAFTISLQRAGTTRVAVNVRGQDFFARRLRGGSRSGLSKWIEARVNGVNPIQCIDIVVTQDYDATLYAFDQSSGGPGVRISDTVTNNFPNGPGVTGPGGNPQGGPTGATNFNRRKSDTATIPQGGNGIMQPRTTSTTPAPGSYTRTYTPFAVNLSSEIVGIFSIGPVAVPMTPPTDLEALAVAVSGFGFGAQWNIGVNLSTWTGTQLPTVAEINQMFTDNGWSSSPLPYETSVDS